MEKFTPGKWFIPADQPDCIVTDAERGDNIICEAPVEDYGRMSKQNWPANSRLIVQAPAMYEILSYLMRRDGFQDKFGYTAGEIQSLLNRINNG